MLKIWWNILKLMIVLVWGGKNISKLTDWTEPASKDKTLLRQ